MESPVIVRLRFSPTLKIASVIEATQQVRGIEKTGPFRGCGYTQRKPVGKTQLRKVMKALNSAIFR